VTPHRRSYDDGCAAAHALDLVGERWALLVVRELLLGPKRFTDLRTGLPTISPNVLTQRLTDLEAVQVVRRRKLPMPASAWVYELTDWGRELEGVILALGRWGARSPFRDQQARLSADSMVLSLRTMVEPPAGDYAASYELHIGDDCFHAELDKGDFHIARGPAAAPDATIEADARTLAGVVFGGCARAEAERCGALRLTGDPTALSVFLGMFALPSPCRPAERTPA
jgi:DNA-binding HxlR family transcriptional regulator